VKQKREIAFVGLGVILAAIIFIVLFGFASGNWEISNFKPQTTQAGYSPIFREDMNKIIIFDGGLFINKYDQIIKNRVLTEALIITSIEEKIPINILVAINMAETKEENIRINAKKLRVLYEKYDCWEDAIIYYNANSEKNIPQQSLAYLKKILVKERELDIAFYSFYNEIKGLK
jgi:hypothetical protein